MTGPAGEVLLTARMPAAPELVGGRVVVPVALSPAPAVYPDRAALVAHLAEGGCIDDAVLAMNTGSGRVVRVHRSAFADHAAGYDQMHLQGSVEGHSVILDEPAPSGSQGAAFFGGRGMPYLSAEDWLIGGSVFVDRYGVTGVSVEQPHRCGDPVTPIAPPPMSPTRAVTIRSAPPGEGLTLDGKPIVTPVTVHLEIGLTYGLHYRRGTAGYGQSVTVTVDGPDEVCVTMDPSDAGCATASP